MPRQLARIVPARPVARALAAAGIAALALTGCAKMDAALSRTWVDISFKPGTSVAAVLRIRAACSHIPNVTAVPLRHHLRAADAAASVQYDTTKASNANVAQLQLCLQKYPAVIGFDPQDSSDSGS
jgi:hypothetical protein